MVLGVFKAKIERNGFRYFAGKHFVDETSELIKKLNKEGRRVLGGIEHKKGIYTVIGEHYIYYLTSSGKKGQISHKDFIEELGLYEESYSVVIEYFKRKFFQKKIVLKNGDKVWLFTGTVLYSLWNTILWLEKRSSNMGSKD